MGRCALMQHVYSSGVYSSTEIPGGSVLGLTVDDPRLTLPRMRCKAEPDLQQAIGNFTAETHFHSSL